MESPIEKRRNRRMVELSKPEAPTYLSISTGNEWKKFACKRRKGGKGVEKPKIRFSGKKRDSLKEVGKGRDSFVWKE